MTYIASRTSHYQIWCPVWFASVVLKYPSKFQTLLYNILAYWVLILLVFDVHVTVHRGKFLIIKPTRCTNYSNLFLELNSTCFGQFLCPSSVAFHCTRSNGICHTGLLTACEQEQMLLLTSCLQTCMTYTIAVCTVKSYWWWTEELSETCRISFQE